MIDEPKLAVLELMRVANGWMVSPGRYDVRNDRLRAPSEMWVFRSWDEAAAFMRRVTETVLPIED